MQFITTEFRNGLGRHRALCCSVVEHWMVKYKKSGIRALRETSSFFILRPSSKLIIYLIQFTGLRVHIHVKKNVQSR